MKSPVTGKEMSVCQETRTANYRGECYSYTASYYLCKDSGEHFTTTALDMEAMEQVFRQYRERHGIPFPAEIKAIRMKYRVSAAKMSRILGFGIDDDAARVATQAPLDDGHSCPVEQRQVGKLPIHPEQRAVRTVEETRDAVQVDEFLDAERQLLIVAYLTRLVEHTHDELLVRGCRHHCAVHVLLALLGTRQARVAFVIEFPHPRENLFDGW